MLVKFNSSSAGEMVTMAPTARSLLQIVGKECSARGVITAEQLPDALLRLRKAVAEEKAQLMQAAQVDSAHASRTDTEGDEAEAAKGAKPPVVTLGQRAWPLIELLERTRNEDGFVLWEAAQDFSQD